MAAEPDRTRIRRMAREYLERGDPLGWFEALYAEAEGDPSRIVWADLKPNPNLVAWLDRTGKVPPGLGALVVGCGLGDDAEELARRGYDVIAFDLSATAIDWCRRRYPESRVEYVAGDLFDPPPAWVGAFDFVFEAYTLQVLPPALRQRAIGQVARLVGPGGTLLVICRAREPEASLGEPPWPLSRDDLALFQSCGLREVRLEDYFDDEDPPVRRFRAEYRF